MVVNMVYYATALIAANFSCSPFRYIWDKTIPGRCVNRKALSVSNLSVSNAALNLLSHLLILLLPHTIIWKLQMTLSRKIGVGIVFSVGLM